MFTQFKDIKMRFAIPMFFLFPLIFTIFMGILVPESLITKFNFLMNLSYFILIFIFYKRSNKESGQIKKELKQIKSFKLWKDMILIFIAQLLFSIASQNIVISMAYQINPEFTNDMYLLNTIEFSTRADLIWMVIFTSLTVPILEEYVFRGVMLSRITHKRNIIVGIIVSSVIFGVLHDLDTLGATLFAVFCCLLYLKYQNILVPIIVHILNNALACIPILFNPQQYTTLEPLTTKITQAYLINGLILLPFSLIFMYWAYRTLKYERKKTDTGEIIYRKVW